MLPFHLLLLISFFVFQNYAFSNTIKSLTKVVEVESSLSNIFEGVDIIVDRIGLSEVFYVTGTHKDFITDSTGTTIIGAASFQYVKNGIVKTTHYGNAKSHKLSYLYHFASSGYFPIVGQQNSPPIIVFMDPSCPNCIYFHKNDLAYLVQKGHSFIYFPSLRDTSNKYRIPLIASYCDDKNQFKNVQSLYSDPKINKSKMLVRGNCLPINEYFFDASIDLFAKNRFLGSPAFLMQSGEVIYGVKAFKRRLDEIQ